MHTDDVLDRFVPPGGTLLGVWAHPDDEAYLSTALMARVVARGGRVVVAYATRGEGGTDDPGTWPPARLAELRSREACEALRLAGAELPRFLGYTDGSCASADPDLAAARVEAVIEEVRPDLVVTFGSDGITGHPDHRAVSSWTVDAWRSVRRRRLDGPRLLLAAMADDFARRHAAFHDEIGLFASGGGRVTDDAELALRVDLTAAELDHKVSVLAAHGSQTRGLASMMGPAAYRQWWSSECFRLPDAAEMGATGTDAGPGWVAV